MFVHIFSKAALKHLICQVFCYRFKVQEVCQIICCSCLRICSGHIKSSKWMLQYNSCCRFTAELATPWAAFLIFAEESTMIAFFPPISAATRLIHFSVYIKNMCILPKNFYLYEGNEISYHATIKNKRTAAIFTVAVRLLYDSVLLSLYLQPALLHSVCDAQLQFISISENTILKIWNYHGIL